MAKAQDAAFVEQVRGFILKQGLICPGEKIVVAVSGGADSVCLLHILFQLREKLGIGLHVAHLNHELRGEDARADARYVARLARRLNLPVTVASRDVRAYQKLHRLSLEEAARQVRYEFLAQVARKVGATKVAVGHTADDHAETVLMHFLRGSGTRGLRGLLPLSRLRTPSGGIDVIRPLLEMRRDEVIAYCHSQRLQPHFDASNASSEFWRNRLRHELLPALKEYNPKIVDALLRIACIARDDIAFIEGELDRCWDEIARWQDRVLVIDRKGFFRLPQALKRHFLRRAIENVRGDIQDIEATHIEALLDVVVKPGGKTVHLPGGLRFSSEYDRYLLAVGEELPSPFPHLAGEAVLNVPGKTLYCGWEITAEVMPRHQVATAPSGDGLTAFFDLKRAGSPLTVHPRRPGDRFQPLGMEGHKKLGEFMIDEHIPRHWRKDIPLVSSPQGIIWVVGYRLDERVKVTEGSLQVLRLTFRRI